MLDKQLQRLASHLQVVAEDDKGQGLVEYALVILLVALAAIVAVTALGVSLQNTIDFVVGQFP